MGEWETEDEYAAAAQASLPTPTDTPYRTPSRASRRSSRQMSSSPDPSSSPPELPSNDRRSSRDIANDESISLLDPRRFTPTLHANLVSEILALRRDQQEKTKMIENLEAELHETRGEHENLETELMAVSKESRKQQRQLALLEGGTSSALSELSRERDDALENVGTVQKRLDAAQKKIRTQEEDSNRVHELWSRDKDTWEDEKRKYERKVHVAESRLKIVLEEVAAYEANRDEQPQFENDTEIPKENGNDNGSIRTMSMTNSIRFSMLNGPNGYAAPKLNGVSLADELDFDADSDDWQTDAEGRESVMSMSHKRNQSRESMMSKTHWRNQSVDSLMRPGSVARSRVMATLARIDSGIIEDDETVPPQKVMYVDTGVQFSPPPSPRLAPTEHVPVVEPPAAITVSATEPGKAEKQHVLEGQHREMEIEANQRRKRVHASPLIIDAGSQTLEDPLSPPRTPASPTRVSPPPPPERSYAREMKSCYTQTETAALKSPTRAPPPPPIPIPQIQLHPPKSRPATPHADHFTLLPQHFKDAACQVKMSVAVPSRSIAVQTEEIRVDKRINLLPPHLHPSAISSAPPSPEPTVENEKRFSPVPGNLPPRNPLRRMRSQNSAVAEIPSSPPVAPTPIETRDAYPGNNDDGPLASGRTALRRPHRSSSLFAGFDNVSSDDGDDFGDGDLSDNDYRTALSAPKPQSTVKRQRFSSPPPPSVPEGVELSEVSKPKDRKSGTRHTITNDAQVDFSFPEAQPFSKRLSMKAVRQLDKPLTLVTTSKPAPMRRTALIHSGVAAHQGRQTTVTITEPPFPIPTRASSRNPPYSVSAPSDRNRSPTSRSGDQMYRGSRGHHYRTGSNVRKVRSAAALPRGGSKYRRRGSRSPPPMSASTEAPESPELPPMPQNDVTSPRYMHNRNPSSRYRSHRHQPSTNTANTANTVNTGITSNTTNTGNASISTNGATSVVDAIAQTMVGEWMFKYVRRRKSFGVPEANGGDDNGNGNGVRHRRWVWLAPYERAVMWSSKQPMSGSALLGKTGRKLTIQSVLDVKDDNPSPKGTKPLFNRSILILTPARALKFTAISAERHYVWLTALSFLAHSSQAVPEIIAAAPAIPQVPNFEMPPKGARLRKNPIRDSIRVAKGKTAAARPGPTSVHSASQHGGTNHSIQEEESYFTDHPKPRVSESAEPPAVPRFTERGYELDLRATHGRKRSNTGSRIPPPISFRGFSGPASTTVAQPTPSHAPSSTAGQSTGTNGSSDIYQSQPGSSVAPSGYTAMSVSGRSSIRTSDASGRPGVVVNNFFDAVGTVRMEAFISPMAMKFDDFPNEQDEMNFASKHKRHSREVRRRRSRNRDSYYLGKRRPSDDWNSGSKTAGEEDSYREVVNNDPFRGF